MTVNKLDVHPVTAYLSSIVWDGTPRLDRWLVDYAGAADIPLVHKISHWALVAAVRRARHPDADLTKFWCSRVHMGAASQVRSACSRSGTTGSPATFPYMGRRAASSQRRQEGGSSRRAN